MATIKYEEALRQIEDIVTRLERGETDIDSLSTELKKAQRLIKICREKLTKTNDEIKNILAEGDEQAD